MTASRGCVKRTQTGGAGCSAGLTVPSILTFIWSFGLYKEFSSGIFDQWLSHGCDLVHLWTGESYPESVVASGGIFVWPDGRENPHTCTAVATYPKGFLYPIRLPSATAIAVSRGFKDGMAQSRTTEARGHPYLLCPRKAEDRKLSRMMLGRSIARFPWFRRLASKPKSFMFPMPRCLIRLVLTMTA